VTPKKKTPAKKQGRGNVTLREVAEECGVAISTVSMVLNRSPLAQTLSAATRARVEETAQRLNYSPDLLARSLKSRHSQTIGVMIFDITDPYCTRLLKGIEEAIEATPFLSLIMSVQNKADLFRRYSKLVQERRVEGLIVVPNWTSLDRSMFSSFARMPCVTIGCRPPVDNMSCVVIDNVAGGFKAMEHLYALGHRKIAILRGPGHLPDSMERLEGIRKFARQAGLSIDPELVMEIESLPAANSSFLEGHRLTLELIGKQRPFTALVAFDDLAAAGAIRAFHESGWELPRRCSVIGFDDVPNAEFISPALTTMRQPLEDMGKLAVEMLLAAVEQKDQTIMVRPSKMFDPSLTVRASTGRCFELTPHTLTPHILAAV
jgi:DNA-binding LacI/PurR family transcriptional regulator